MALTLYKRINLDNGETITQDDILLAINKITPGHLSLNRDKARRLLDAVDFFQNKRTIDDAISGKHSNTALQLEFSSLGVTISYTTATFDMTDIFMDRFGEIINNADGLIISPNKDELVVISIIINNLWY